MGSVAMLSQAQDLTPVKTWEPGTKTWSPQAFALDAQYSSETVTGKAGGNAGLADLAGLGIQGADKFYYFYNGVHNQNSGGREVIIYDPAVKAGQRILVTAQIEEGGRVGGDGTCAYVGLNTTLRSISNKVTAGTKGVAEADFDPATMQQVLTFDVTADGSASFYLNRTGGFTKIELCDVEQLTAENTATYTVKFVDENGTEIKEAITRTGKIGGKAEFLIGDDDSVVTDNAKNNYVGNDYDEVTLAETGSVVNIKFQSVTKLSYTVNFMDNDERTLVASETGVVFADEAIASYSAWPVAADGTVYYGATNTSDLKELYSPEEQEYFVATNNYSVDVKIDGQVFVIPALTLGTFFNTEEGVNWGLVFYTEAEDVAPFPAATVGASKGMIGQVVRCKNGQSDKLVQLGFFTPGTYRIISKITANQGRNLVVRSFKSTPADKFKDNLLFDALGDIDAVFTVEEADCDSTNAEGVKGVALTLGGKDGKGDGTLYNQSADYDYVLILKDGAESIKILPELPSAIKTVEAADVNDGKVYNLAGQLQNEKNLKPGLYIKNGKLIQVK